ncbi:MAG: hypothetical protein KDC67_16030, partial [Ignavibacteriae bacterium]|nr:hypothetical protein [Ignavibacteriota bacterium]
MANNLEIYKELLDNSRDINEYDIESTKEIRFPINSEFDELLKKHDIIQTQKAGKICVEKKDLPFSFFLNLEEFNNEVRSSHLKKDCVIHDYDGGYLWFSHNENKIYTDKGIEKELFIFNNAKTYFESKEFFKSNYKYNDGDYEFTDFYSEADCVIGFSLPGNKTRLVFKFPNVGIPLFSNNVDYSLRFKNFVDLFKETKHHPIFLKNAMVSNLFQESKDLYSTFFDKLDK